MQHGRYGTPWLAGLQRSSPWSPKSKAGLQLFMWADAGITLSGSSIVSWADQSGNGHTHTPATTPTAPTLTTNAPNSRNSATFNGSSQRIYSTDLITSATTWTVVVVHRVNAVALRASYAFGATNVNGMGTYIALNGHAERDVLLQGVVVKADANNSATTAWECWVIQNSGSTTTLRVNGVASTLTGTGTAVAATAGSVIGAQSSGGSSAWNGDIALVLVWDTNLSAGELTSLNTWINGLYGLAA